MPCLGDLFDTLEPRIRGLGEPDEIELTDLQTSAFVVERHRDLVIYYAPVDWLWLKARVAIVGITPSANTMLMAYRTAARRLAEGATARGALQAVKREALFSGFRRRLTDRLDALGVARHLGVESSAMLPLKAGYRITAAACNSRACEGSNPQLQRPITPPPFAPWDPASVRL